MIHRDDSCVNLMKNEKINLTCLSDLKLNESKIYEDTTKNIFFQKLINDLCVSDSLIFGIDEAGRGPVLGYMLICAFFCRKNDEDILREIGCKDSKIMTPKGREQVFNSICAHPKLGFTVKAISPHFISDSAFQKPKYNLNTMSIDTGVELTQNPKHDRIDSIFADMIGNNLVYENKLKLNFPKSNIVVQPKADSKYLVVGAASICAKVIRDHILTNWRFTENIANRNFGSGYTSDKTTIDWLNDVIDPQTGFPNIVRYSWSTCTKIIAKRAPLLVRKPDSTLVKPRITRKRRNSSPTSTNQKLKFKSIH